MQLLQTMPAGGDGVTTFLGLTDTPAAYTGEASKYARVNGGESALEFHDLLNVVNTWAALQTFSAGIKLAAAQQVEDSGGTGRFLPATASPHATLTGDTQISGGHLGVDWAPSARATLELALPTLTLSSSLYYTIQFAAQVATITGDAVWLKGLFATPVVNLANGTTGAVLTALDFLTGIASLGDASAVSGVKSGLRLFAYYGTIAEWQSVDCPALIVTVGDPTITTSHGVRIRNQGHACVGTVMGLKIEPQTGADANYLIWAERSAGNPSLRLDAGDPPDSASATLGDSNLYLAWMENGVVNLRQVRWVDSGAGGGAGIPANTKLLYAV